MICDGHHIYSISCIYTTSNGRGTNVEVYAREREIIRDHANFLNPQGKPSQTLTRIHNLLMKTTI